MKSIGFVSGVTLDLRLLSTKSGANRDTGHSSPLFRRWFARRLFAKWRCAANINNPTAIMSPANAIVPRTVHPQDGTIAALTRDSRYRFHRIFPGYKYHVETKFEVGLRRAPTIGFATVAGMTHDNLTSWRKAILEKPKISEMAARPDITHPARHCSVTEVINSRVSPVRKLSEKSSSPRSRDVLESDF